MAEILDTQTPDLFESAIDRSTELLRSGELVALPTETVYGLAANAFNPEAVEKIFRIKERPAANPIIVHVASLEMARRCVANWPPLATKLASAFWPGPLTLVLPRSEEIPIVVTAGGDTVGVRWPNHPFMQRVIRACGFPLAAPSANLSSRTSPTTAEHVRKSLGEKIALIIDGGPCRVGIESTVLDLTTQPPHVLRPGMIHAEALLAITGDLTVEGGGRSAPWRSPGQLPRHYAPRAQLALLQWKNGEELKSQVANLHHNISDTYVITHTQSAFSRDFGGVSVVARDAEVFARAIYAELHRADEAGANLIVVEELPRTVEWQAIADRLKRGQRKIS